MSGRTEAKNVVDRPRQGELLIICPQCGARCYARGVTPSITYYYCEEGCLPGQKIARPKVNQ